MKFSYCLAIVAMLTGGLSADQPTKAKSGADAGVRDQKKEASPTKPGDAPLKKLVKANVEEMNNALMNDDFAKIVDLTHPKVVEMAGGRDKMISVVATGIKDMKTKGFVIQSNKVEDPSDPVAAGSDLFIVVPHLMEMKAPGGKLSVKGFVIGVSGDKGKSWKFVNGDIDLKQIKQVLPNLPEKLKLPEKQKPEFEKD